MTFHTGASDLIGEIERFFIDLLEFMSAWPVSLLQRHSGAIAVNRIPNMTIQLYGLSSVHEDHKTASGLILTCFFF